MKVIIKTGSSKYVGKNSGKCKKWLNFKTPKHQPNRKNHSDSNSILKTTSKLGGRLFPEMGGRHFKLCIFHFLY